MHWTLRVAVGIWVGWAGVGWAQAVLPLNILGTSVVYFADEQEVLVSIAFHREPDFTAVTPSGSQREWMGIAVYFSGRVTGTPDRHLDGPDTAGAASLRAGNQVLDAIVWEQQGAVLSVRLPFSTLGDPDGRFAFLAMSGGWTGLQQELSYWSKYTGPSVSIPDTCDGKPATVIGTAGHDVIYAEWSPETGAPVVLALTGDDLVFCRTFSCTVCGGPGHDHLHGGGQDRLFGEEGHDLLIGGPGNDYLDGGPGEDVLKGGNGTDTLIGGTGQDICCGEGQTDTATGCELTVSVP